MNNFTRLFSICLLCVVSIYTQAQTHTPKYISMTSKTKGYYEYLPEGYNPSGTTTYPLILFLTGIGEFGNGTTDLPLVLKNGPPKLIKNGTFPKSFTVGGKVYRFIVITPQFLKSPRPSAIDIDSVLNFIITHYKVNKSRIYLTGLSYGGGLCFAYCGNNLTYAKRISAIMPTASATPVGGDSVIYARSRIIASGNIPVWATHNNADPSEPVATTNAYINYINKAPAPSPLAKKTIFTASYHDSWTKTYDPNFRENGLNIYEWMLQYQKGSWTIPGKVQAENYSTMYGVTKQTTTDIGIGQNLTNIDFNDWMNYSINVMKTGTYALKLRLASAVTGAKLEVRKADATVLKSVSIPNTGGWQTWKDVNVSINLVAGIQTIRIISSSSPRWNVNYFELNSTTTTALKSPEEILTKEAETPSTKVLNVFPNPFSDEFIIQLNNKFTGPINVELIALDGNIKREYKLYKGQEGLMQTRLSAAQLPQGSYLIKVQMKDWTESLQIIKLSK